MSQDSDWATKLGIYLKQKRGKEPLQKTAQKVGVSENSLEEIEKGNIGALSLGEFRELIKKAYGVNDIATVPEGSGRRGKGWIVIRDEATPYREWGGTSIKWKYWLNSLEDGKMMPEILVLPARRLKTNVGKTQEGQHSGEELLYILSGKLKVHLWDVNRDEYGPPFELTRGDILHFKSQLKHFVENGSSAYEVAILVVRMLEA